jgi:hypothetical protein
MIWIIFAVLSFIGGQMYLFHCLKQLDQFLEKRQPSCPSFTYDDDFRYYDDYKNAEDSAGDDI